MFEDKRSKRVLLVAHCIFNQSAKIDQCAHYPGAIKEVAEILIDSGVGLIQMPCPELLYLGLDRQADPETRPTVEAEDTRVARRMVEAPAKALCAGIVRNLVHQVEEYKKHGFEVIGILGINGSPTCGVETTWWEDQERPGPGVFMQMLNEELARKEMVTPARGIRAYRPEEAAAVVREVLKA